VPGGLFVIAVHELTKVFGTGPTAVRAVDRLTFSVPAGEVYGLLGPNGAGKTTTLRMLLGLLRPTSGDATLDGFSATREPMEVKKRLGLVSASAGLYQWLTPREMLAYFADLYGLSPAQAEAQTTRLASILDLGGFLDRRCATLSTGQRQRVNLARALVHNPPIMLLDEPTRGLDVVGSRIIFEYIRLLRREGKAAIVSTHRLDEAERFCDRFGLLHRGRLRYEGTLDELRERTGRQRLVDMFFDLLDERDAGAVPAA
jgi:sodium transport system ATP-binding protein